MLYIMEAAIDMLGTIISVYPDLRAECAPIFDRLTKRFDEVATVWNLMPASEPTEQQPEQPPEQPSASPDGAPSGGGGGEHGE
jgi:hypothetical protein